MDINKMTQQQIREHLQKLEMDGSNMIMNEYEERKEAIYRLIQDLAQFKRDNNLDALNTRSDIEACMDEFDLRVKADEWRSSQDC
jgi:predicted ArsR family transcriptional regulator